MRQKERERERASKFMCINTCRAFDSRGMKKMVDGEIQEGYA